MKYCELNKWRWRNFEENVKKYGKELGIEVTKSAEDNFRDRILSENKEAK